MLTDTDIDLRLYIRLLLSKWKWIIPLVVIFSIFGFLYSSLLPVKYVSYAMVAVIQPRYVYNFDPKVQTVDVKQIFPAYSELATSPEILDQLLKEWTDKPDSIKTSDDLKSVIGVLDGSSSNIFYLQAKLDDPKKAADLANLWASMFVKKAKELFGGQSSVQVDFFSAQVDQAKIEVQNADKALVAFESKNEISILQTQLDSLLQTQNDYLTTQRNLTYLSQDVASLKQQVDSSSGDQKISLGNQLNILNMQLRAFNSHSAPPIADKSNNNPVPNTASDNLPFQIQVTNLDTSSTRVDLTQSLSELAKVIDTRSKDILVSLKGLDSQVLDVQQKLQDLKNQKAQLDLAHSLATDTFTSLSRKEDETRISIQDSEGEVQVVSRAVVSENPVPKNVARNTAIGGFAGGMLSILVVLFLSWWRNDNGKNVKTGGDNSEVAKN